MQRHNEAENESERATLEQSMCRLGKKHTCSGITPEMYIYGGKALLSAVKDRLTYTDNYNNESDRGENQTSQTLIGNNVSFNSQSFSRFVFGKGKCTRQKASGLLDIESDISSEPETCAASVSVIPETSSSPLVFGESSKVILTNSPDDFDRPISKFPSRLGGSLKMTSINLGSGREQIFSVKELPLKCRALLGFQGIERLYLDCHGLISPIRQPDSSTRQLIDKDSPDAKV